MGKVLTLLSRLSVWSSSCQGKHDFIFYLLLTRGSEKHVLLRASKERTEATRSPLQCWDKINSQVHQPAVKALTGARIVSQQKQQ
jgi:hypothetical protein